MSTASKSVKEKRARTGTKSRNGSYLFITGWKHLQRYIPSSGCCL